MTPLERERLQELIIVGRKVATPVGSMHSLWDVIFDAEALLKGKETLLKGTEQEVHKQLVEWLEEHEAKQL